MTKKPEPSYTVAYTVTAVVIILAIGFAVGWWYLKLDKHESVVEATMAYATIGPLVITSEGYSIKTTLAVQTSLGDAAWARKNAKALAVAFEKQLSQEKPEALLAPNGLLALHRSLKDAANATLKTSNVQEVLITDFVMVSND